MVDYYEDVTNKLVDYIQKNKIDHTSKDWLLYDDFTKEIFVCDEDSLKDHEFAIKIETVDGFLATSNTIKCWVGVIPSMIDMVKKAFREQYD